MKKIKINLSKTSWIILSVGVFIVVLAGLGVTYSSQLKKNSKLDEELELTELRLAKYNIEELQLQEAELEAILDDSSSLHDTGKLRLQESIESIDVTNRCYVIASASNVEIIDIGTTDIQQTDYMNLECERITVQVMITGNLEDMINFVINMNESFDTGYIDAIQTVIEEIPYTSVQMVIYSYKGE